MVSPRQICVNCKLSHAGVLPPVSLLHHPLKEILVIRVQLGFHFGEVGAQLVGHDDPRLPQLLGVICRVHTRKRPQERRVPPGTEEPST